MSVRMSFHGAVGMVTGSCHLLKAAGMSILIDCGLFQGENRWRALNHADFGFDPASLDAVLLTHAHLDHCGRLPLLVKAGFKGQIICTPATLDIAKIALVDSAKVQEEDYENWRRINLKQGFIPRPPLYTTMDAVQCLGHFRPLGRYDRPVELSDKVSVTFRDAGHILGAAFLEITVRNEMKVVYSGDLGNSGKPIIRDPSFTKNADVVVLETTYGDRDHRPIGESIDELAGIIRETFDRGGNVLIPSFAIERAQDLIFVFRELHEKGRLPDCQVFLDSPMGINVTNVMRRHPECFDEATREVIQSRRDPFDFPGLQMTKTRAASKRINYVRKNAIIIAGAGMCNGGRIRQHMKYNIWRPESSLVFIGYQAEGTLGRELVDGASEVSFLGENFKVNCHVHTVGGFSSHADRSGLMKWLEHTPGIGDLFLLHGESGAIGSFRRDVEAAALAGRVHVPGLHDEHVL